MLIPSPFFRSPFTDLTGCLLTHQQDYKCSEREMDMMECLEAYGAERGKRMCSDIINDYNECVFMTLQIKRFTAMKEERLRQYRNGERSKEELYAPPPRIDAY